MTAVHVPSASTNVNVKLDTYLMSVTGIIITAAALVTVTVFVIKCQSTVQTKTKKN